MLKPMTEKEVALTVKNILSACKDITKLNKRGYNFLYLASGFIAHYNIHGFIENYSDGSLASEILRFRSMNEWKNFREGERDYEYYHQKGEIYKTICEALTK